MVAAQQVRDPRSEFEEAGWTGPVPLFDAAACTRIAAALWSPGAAPPVDWYKGCAAGSRLFHELATFRPLLDLVAELIGEDVMLWGASVIRRAPGESHPWHTDVETAAAPGGTATAWIGLRHTSRHSCLKLLERSHRLGVSAQEMVGREGLARGQADDETVENWVRSRDPLARVVRPVMGDGEALIFDGRLWHGSDNRAAWYSRTAILLQYARPDVAIRIPDLSAQDLPFRFHDAPRPPCIMVHGTDTHGVNRIVPAPPRTDPEGRPAISSWVRTLELADAATDPSGRQHYGIFRGQTQAMADLSAHASVLNPGRTPHPPHIHPEEEILVMLAGEASLVMVDGARERTHRLRPGSFVYYPTGQYHTIRNDSGAPAAYLMFKWQGEATGEEEPLGTTIVDFAAELAKADRAPYATRRLLDHPTRYLSTLHAHVTSLQPGAGYPPHADAYDVAILVLEGTVETLGSRAGPMSVIFYAAGEPHGMHNPGPSEARYLVFEFHGTSMRPGTRRRGSLRRLARRSELARRLWHRLKRATGQES
jgi:quercetin dioxygenase-like cupin family protein